MSQATDYLEGQLIAHLFRTASFAKPTVLAFALFTAAPGEAGGGTEVTGGSYARAQRNPLDANWSAPTGGNGQTSNVADIAFAAPTANWGVVTHTAVFDAASAGNMLVYATLAQSRIINNGDQAPSFAAGAFTVTIA